jgi:hypothetical protein
LECKGSVRLTTEQNGALLKTENFDAH